MKFINPNLDSETLLKEPRKEVTERIISIMCDKYGLEGDCTIEQIANDIYDELFKIVL